MVINILYALIYTYFKLKNKIRKIKKARENKLLYLEEKEILKNIENKMLPTTLFLKIIEN